MRLRIPHLSALQHHPTYMSTQNADFQAESTPESPQFDERLLDNPIWNSLGTEHRPLAQSEGAARRYPPAIGPLAGTPDQSEKSYKSLQILAGPGGLLGLFLPDPPALPHSWSLFRGGLLTQMICRTPQLVGSEQPCGGSESPQARSRQRACYGRTCRAH